MSQKSGYLLVMGTPTDRARMDAYQDLLPPIYEGHGGYRLVMGGRSGGVTYLSGGSNELSVMLAHFPTPESVSEFWWSDEYREAYRVRKKAGRFAAAGLPGLDGKAKAFDGAQGFLLVLASPKSPGRWRRFADALSDGLKNRGATMLIDDGPEATERLESRLPGSHVVVAMLPSEDDAKKTWAELKSSLSDLIADAEPMIVAALKGLPGDHPWRLTQ